MTGSTVDEVRTSSKKLSSGTDSTGLGNTNYVDDIFGCGNGVQQNNAMRPSPVDQDSLFGDFLHGEKGWPEAKQNISSSSTTKNSASGATSVGNDFTSLFGDVSTSSGEFLEIEGEPEERRRARLSRHIRTNARMAEALSEKNQRDLQSQHEQEEKHRVAQILEHKIKHWATGKEGNLRARGFVARMQLAPGFINRHDYFRISEEGLQEGNLMRPPRQSPTKRLYN